MAKARWLAAACTVAMVAAVPALAQQGTTPDATGAGSMPQTSAGQTATPGQSTTPGMTAPAMSNGSGQMSQGGSTGGSSASSGSGTMHHAMGSHMRHPMHAGRNDSSQNAEVDRLNEQSYQAATQGQNFSSTSGGSGMGTMSGGSSGSMGTMSGGSSSGMGGSSAGSSGDTGTSGGKM